MGRILVPTPVLLPVHLCVQPHLGQTEWEEEVRGREVLSRLLASRGTA